MTQSPILKTSGSSAASDHADQLNEIMLVLNQIRDEMAGVKQRILALELLDQRMTRIERHAISLEKKSQTLYFCLLTKPFLLLLP